MQMDGGVSGSGWGGRNRSQVSGDSGMEIPESAEVYMCLTIPHDTAQIAALLALRKNT